MRNAAALRFARVVSVAALAACGSSHPSASGDGPGSGPGTGCGSASLLENPADFAAHGPWAVGVRTVMLPASGGGSAAGGLPLARLTVNDQDDVAGVGPGARLSVEIFDAAWT